MESSPAAEDRTQFEAVIPFLSLPDRIPTTTLDYFKLFATHRADRRPLFHNRAEQAFFEGI